MTGGLIHRARRPVSTAILLVLAGAIVACLALPAAGAADTPQSAEGMDAQRLLGRWVRPDGGYVLELKEVQPDGTVKAAYFNPRSINVEQAQIRRSEGEISLFVKLRDANYPGSTYSLRYDPKADRLVGTYYQAVYGQTYAVEFLRAR